MTSHALVLAGQTAAQCTSQAVGQSAHWFQVVQACGSTATTIGVLIALYIAVIRDPREASEEHRHHMAQIEAIHSVKRERAAAHARKVVPSCARTPMFGDSSWTVSIDNASNALTTASRSPMVVCRPTEPWRWTRPSIGPSGRPCQDRCMSGGRGH